MSRWAQNSINSYKERFISLLNTSVRAYIAMTILLTEMLGNAKDGVQECQTSLKEDRTERFKVAIVHVFGDKFLRFGRSET